MKPGDIVYLKSGSPALTVKLMYGDVAVVTWFDDSETPCTAEFPVVCLSEVNHSSWTAK